MILKMILRGRMEDLGFTDMHHILCTRLTEREPMHRAVLMDALGMTALMTGIATPVLVLDRPAPPAARATCPRPGYFAGSKGALTTPATVEEPGANLVNSDGTH